MAPAARMNNAMPLGVRAAFAWTRSVERVALWAAECGPQLRSPPQAGPSHQAGPADAGGTLPSGAGWHRCRPAPMLRKGNGHGRRSSTAGTGSSAGRSNG
jgi:hypothetical protein